jgi:beta-galactosidase
MKRNNSIANWFGCLKRWGALTAIAGLAGLCSAADSPRERVSIDSSWRFHLGDPTDITNAAETNVTYYPEIPDLQKLSTNEIAGPLSETNLMTLRPPLAGLGENVSFVQNNFDDSSWRSLDLPHDWVVELPYPADGSDGGLDDKVWSPIGWYRRTFTLPASDAGKSLWLEFDGVYRNCLVWLNGHILGRNVSGYSSFSLDVSKFANPGGTNVLVVRVDASRREGWYYEGAGIYRHVWLVKTDPVHVAHWGTYVTSAVTNSNAVVTIQTEVANEKSNSVACKLASAIYDAAGHRVAADTARVAIAVGTNQIVTQTVTIANARLWSVDFPNLYQLVQTVKRGGAACDVVQTPFGVRTFTWSGSNGLFLNGQRIEVKGVANHQDHAGVGLALPDRIQYYRVGRLKALGFNAIRIAPHCPTPELLEACDQLGMLMLDETRRIGDDPETLGELERGILRDRNHPSVFLWSLGNEEYLQGDTNYGVPIMTAMRNVQRQLDPSRFCTIAMNWDWGKGFSTVVDVQGFNYLKIMDETVFHTNHPNQPSIATEEGSQVGDRGIYSITKPDVVRWGYDGSAIYTMIRQIHGTTTNSYVTAYDVPSGVGWASTVEQMWQFYSAHPFVAGFFNWTGFDYRGEPSPTDWPAINAHFGIFDTCGFPKDNAYYFQANWLPKPVLHIFPHWNWAGNEGRPVNIWCFANCETVELFLNGVSQGAKSVNVQSHVEWTVPYAPGTLKAVGYYKGRAVITNTVATTGAPAAITIAPDRNKILADGRDVSLVKVSVVDAQGNVVPTAMNTVTFTVGGGGKLIGLGNGDPNCHESDKATNNIGVRSVFNGLAQVIVQSGNRPGKITLTATSPGLASAAVTIKNSSKLPLPAAPAGLCASPDKNQIALCWDIVPGAVTYNVKRAVGNGSYKTICRNTAAITFTDTHVVPGTAYRYVVSAVNAAGESPDSAGAGATPFEAANK